MSSEFNFPTNAFGYVPGTIPAKIIYADTAPTNPVEALFWMNTAAGELQGTLSIRTSIVDNIPAWVPLNSEGLLRAQLEMLTSTVPIAGVPAEETSQMGFFVDGIVLRRKNHLVLDSTGQAWFWKGALPKTVSAGSTPETSGGVGPAKWAKVITAFDIGDFQTGFTATNASQFFIWPSAIGGDNKKYVWQGVFPKVVPANSSPESTGGIGDNAWLSLSYLEDALADGTANIGGQTAQSVADLRPNLASPTSETPVGGVAAKHLRISKESIVNVADYDSIAAAVAVSAGKTLYFGDFDFDADQQFVIPITTNILMSPAAQITATTAVESIFRTDTGNARQRVYHLTNIDCAGLAGTPLHLVNGANCSISASNVIAPAMYGLWLGSSSGGMSYGHHIQDYRANRQLGATSSNILENPIANAGTVGLFEQNTTDIKGSLIEMVGFQKGHIGGGTGLYFSFHAWASQKQNLMDYGFIPSGSTKYFGCHADQVQIGGWLIGSGKWRVGMYGCVHFNSPNGGTDVGTSTSVILDPEVGGFACYGLEIKGSVKGVAKDFEITNTQLDNTQFDIQGTTYENVVTRNAQYKRRNRGQNIEAVTATGSRGLQLGTSDTQTFFQDDRAGGLFYRGSAAGFEMNIGQKPMAWNGNLPIARPTIIGSRDSNTALQNLLQALASYGLIINDTIS